jgi:hypothetical protein
MKSVYNISFVNSIDFFQEKISQLIQVLIFVLINELNALFETCLK